MFGHRHTQYGCNQGHLGGKTSLEKCLLCVTGNNNELERPAHGGAFAPKQSFLGLVWPRCALPSIQCVLQKWAE